MATNVELKEQMKVLKAQQKLALRDVNRLKKDYKIWTMLMEQHRSFCYVKNWKSKYNSFKQLIVENKWTNTIMNKIEFEFLFTELGFKDVEFFTAFIKGEQSGLDTSAEDNTCCVCYNEYTLTGDKSSRKFRNCSHSVCYGCYGKLRTEINGYRTCVMCRISENPRLS